MAKASENMFSFGFHVDYNLFIFFLTGLGQQFPKE